MLTDCLSRGMGIPGKNFDALQRKFCDEGQSCDMDNLGMQGRRGSVVARRESECEARGRISDHSVLTCNYYQSYMYVAAIAVPYYNQDPMNECTLARSTVYGS